MYAYHVPMRRTKKMKRISIFLPDRVLKYFARESESRNIPQAELIRRVLDVYVEPRELKTKGKKR